MRCSCCLCRHGFSGVCTANGSIAGVWRRGRGATTGLTLNTLTPLMVDLGRLPGPHDVFLCGEDWDAKAVVASLLRSFGWTAPIDLGGIDAAPGMEGMMPFWLRLWRALGTAEFNYRVVR